MTENIKLELSEDKIAIATMENGENRFKLSFTQQCNKILDKVESDATIRALIKQCQGKFFSNGLDIYCLVTQSEDYFQQLLDANAALFRRICLFPIPIVAIINGFLHLPRNFEEILFRAIRWCMFGAGSFLAFSCDYRVMRSDRGWLCWPESIRQMKFQQPSIELIRAKIPKRCAEKDAILFSRMLTAKEAQNLQLVDDITTEDKLYDSASNLSMPHWVRKD